MIDKGIKCCEVEKNCSIYPGLCNPAWVVPLYIPQTAPILRSEVLDSSVGPYVNFHSDIMWVEFVGSLLMPEGYSLGALVFAASLEKGRSTRY